MKPVLPEPRNGMHWKEMVFPAEYVQSLIDQAYEAGVRDAVPEGWKAVPVEPSAEMISKAMKECGGIGGGSCGEYAGIDWDDLRSVYEAMLSASPEPKK